MTLATGRPHLKLDRAKHHAEDLRQSIAAYREGGGYSVGRAPQADGSVLLRLDVAEPPPLEQWSLVFGDCMHNLRSGLDHLAWELDSKPDRQTAFPIFMKRPDTWPTLSMERMDPHARRIVERVQPFQMAHTQVPVMEHPLATVHALDIADKHKVLTVTLGAVGGDSISGVPFGSRIESTGWHRVGPSIDAGIERPSDTGIQTTPQRRAGG